MSLIKGFTLVELLSIVFAILAIIVGVIIPIVINN